MKERKKTLHIRLDDDLYDKVIHYTTTKKITRNELVNRTIYQFFSDTNANAILRGQTTIHTRTKKIFNSITITQEISFILLQLFLLNFPAKKENEINPAQLKQRIQEILTNITENIITDNKLQSKFDYEIQKRLNEQIQTSFNEEIDINYADLNDEPSPENRAREEAI